MGLYIQLAALEVNERQKKVLSKLLRRASINMSVIRGAISIQLSDQAIEQLLLNVLFADRPLLLEDFNDSLTILKPFPFVQFNFDCKPFSLGEILSHI